MSDIITSAATAAEDDAYNKAISNYLLFRSKLEGHQHFDKEAVARIKRSFERLMQNRPILFEKIFSGGPEQLQEVKSEVNARIYELKHPSSESSSSTSQYNSNSKN